MFLHYATFNIVLLSNLSILASSGVLFVLMWKVSRKPLSYQNSVVTRAMCQKQLCGSSCAHFHVRLQRHNHLCERRKKHIVKSRKKNWLKIAHLSVESVSCRGSKDTIYFMQCCHRNNKNLTVI